jgi:transmembrane sensor
VKPSASQYAEDPRKDAAIDWFLRREAGLSEAEAERFEAWLDESPANRDAYGAVEDFWAGAAQLETLGRFDDKRRAILKSVDRSRATRRIAVAGLMAVVLGAAGAGYYSFGAYKPLANQSFRTAVGQQATVTLPDGSAVTLNTDSVVHTRTDGERRLVYLDKGQAFFRVAHDRRHPFVVSAAGRTVTALGTAFDVRVDGDALKVVLVEGRIRVAAPAPPPTTSRAEAPGAAHPIASPPPVRSTDMEAGSQLVALGQMDWRLTRTDAVRATSWTHGKIVFDDATLGDVVAELNRYSSRKIVIADAHLAGERLSGIYKPGDIEDFARALKHTGLAELKEESSGEIRIVAMK